ncbi:hypothetical protein [Streptomyces ortus]|uniref:Uncharacterized protein n=1 Tax=Streptomyces ortus TaxID=2867268 RepID=A0ABT3UWZ8_9ACTN|nr:hypothetical protein [Streptomyces ortus]MCX4232032.1 hypothetical protein [Streptomyces ortus]
MNRPAVTVPAAVPESAGWHVVTDPDGQPYPTRHHADVDDVTLIDVTDAQLNYLRAIHEAGHAVAVLLGGGHLHSAEIAIGEADGDHGGVVHACNLADGHAYAAYSAAGERAADRWMREAGLWTPKRAVINEVAARGDRRQFLTINPHVGFGDREVDYLVVHDLADAALDRHWAAVVRVADRLVQEPRLDADTIVGISGIPNGPASDVCPTKPAAVPHARDWWEETPAEAARYDRAWDADDHDIHRDEE